MNVNASILNSQLLSTLHFQLSKDHLFEFFMFKVS